MSDPFLAEIRVVSFNFPPKGWAFCNGQLLPINQNQALFSLLGTTYGGDGRVNFALPNLQGRIPVHMGSLALGSAGGQATVTLAANQLPVHQHSLLASADLASSTSPAGNVLGAKGRGGRDVYAAPADLTPLASEAVSATGGSQPHNNVQPYLVLNFTIALQGIFPSQT